MVFKRQVEGVITKAEKCKIAVFSCPLDITQTETKGTILLKNADELVNYSQGEEQVIKQQINEIAATGIKVIVAGGKIGDLTLHYCEQAGLMVVRLNSKFDLRRLCKAIGATPLPKLTPPSASELGECDHVYVDEIGDTSVIIFKQDKAEASVSTIILRGSTNNILDDLERAVDDGVNAYKQITKDPNLLAGAGAVEIELAKRIASYGETCSGMEQYSMKKYAEAFEALPKAIAENTGIPTTEVISMLYAEHQSDNETVGVNITDHSNLTIDAAEAGLYDPYLTKYWAIKYSTVAACTILRVDQIIMARQAGGPKPKENKDWDED